MMDAHLKNVEKSSFGGKFDPNAGLASSGIAGTGAEKDKEDESADGKTPASGGASSATSAAAGGSGAAAAASTPATPTPPAGDVEMKDVSKKDDAAGKLQSVQSSRLVATCNQIGLVLLRSYVARRVCVSILILTAFLSSSPIGICMQHPFSFFLLFIFLFLSLSPLFAPCSVLVH